jgi:hypothetical protein
MAEIAQSQVQFFCSYCGNSSGLKMLGKKMFDNAGRDNHEPDD